MISRIDVRGSLPADLHSVLPRADLDVASAVGQTAPIVEDVRVRGVEAVRDLTERFDGVDRADPTVPMDAARAALDGLDPRVRAGLEESIRRARLVHRDQLPADVTTRVVPGGSVTERFVPVARVGLYAPGGQAAYPSSVVMNVVPAQQAGVGSIAVASPPQRDSGGLPHPVVLATCALLEVDEVYAVGGAQAVAMFAYGAGSCRPVNMLTGPGNIWVTAAKRLVKGVVGVDTEAGPTEIAILADASADPVHVAADLVSQAEHDTAAAAVLVTDSPELASDVETQLAEQVAATEHSERISAALAGPQSGIVLVDDIEAGRAVIDAYAGEHVEILTRDAHAVAGRVRNAGAIFIGPHAPVSLGDYCAGSNHVLPTGGCARHSGGLSVRSYLRGIHIVDYDSGALAEAAHHVTALADAEDLPAHGAAIRARFGWRTPGGDP